MLGRAGRLGAADAWGHLHPGQQLVLVDAAGTRHSYLTLSVRAYDKARDFPAELINATTGPETLVLVTCGGPYVGGNTGYRDNVVITAVAM